MNQQVVMAHHPLQTIVMRTYIPGLVVAAIVVGIIVFMETT
jgi:hypothetical protein